jgi:hypothetical protein
MTHRHYGVPVAKPRPAYTRPTRAAGWSNGAIIGVIVVVLIVVGVIVYGLSWIVTDTVNATASASHSHMTGQGSPAPTGAPSGTVR